MKKTRFMACLMAIMMLVSLLTTTAHASSNIHIVASDATIYVNDSVVQNINAYLDGYGEVRVETANDLFKIFPNDGATFANDPSLSSQTGIIVTQWVVTLGYGCSQSENQLYIYTNKTPSIEIPTLPTEPSTPTVPESPPAEVFVNGLRIDNADVHVYGGEFFVNNTNALRTIFPKETAGSSLPTTLETTSLRTWANKYKYTLVSSGDRVYLNNDGKKPVEVTLNGTPVEFPDQQPIVVDPGRTMIPIRAVSELINSTVEWDAQNKRVRIAKGNSIMILWVDVQSYWLNNVYHKMDVSPYILNGRTMVPIRFITETFGYTVKWDSSAAVPVVRLSSK